MSLILAHHTPKGAVVVADSQISYGEGVAAGFAPKIHMIGSGNYMWIVGFTGSTVSAAWMLPELRRAAANLDQPESALLAAHEKVLPRCGPCATGEFPRTGVTTVLVSREGIAVLDGCGFIKTDRHDVFVAAGCVEEYANGWWDAHDGNAVPEVEMVRMMIEAKHRFPGIGGETTVLRLAFE